LRIVSFAIQAIPTGIAMSREVNKINQNQTDIINEINTAPYSIIAVLPSQVQFVDDLQMVTRLIMGIVISYGAINQMVFKNALKNAKINKTIGIHGLRHSYATHLIESGADIRFLRAFLKTICTLLTEYAPPY
jgi:site-specific recombinase XerC